MIRQFHFRACTQKNGQQGLPYTCVHSSIIHNVKALFWVVGGLLLIQSSHGVKKMGGSTVIVQWPCVLQGSTVAQSYLTLCNPMDYSTPGFPVHGISQARILEQVAISFSRDLPDLGIKPTSPTLQVDSLPLLGIPNLQGR